MSEPTREVHHHHYGWCCWGPWTRRSAAICGIALVILGASWLLANMGLITEEWWQVAVPLLLVAWGVGVLLDGRRLPDGEPSERTPG